MYLPLLVVLAGLACAIGGVLLVVLSARIVLKRPAALGWPLAGLLLVAGGVVLVLLVEPLSRSPSTVFALAADNWMADAGWTALAFCAALVIWGLHSDLAAARRRCPKCWYSMEAAGS